MRTQQSKPAHIPADWWARASWKARQAAVDADLKRRREARDAEERRIEQLRANVEAARAAHEAIYRPTVVVQPEPLKPTREARTEAFIEAVDHLLNTGHTAEQVAAIVGSQLGALEKRMRRNGRPDLAHPFSRARNHERKEPCIDCGTPAFRPHQRCRRCYNLARTTTRRAA